MDDGLGSVEVKSPGALGLVIGDWVEEVSVENGVITLDLVLLLFVLHVAEVVVLRYIERLFLLEALKCFVTAHLVHGREFKGAMRHDMRIVLDSAHHKG